MKIILILLLLVMDPTGHKKAAEANKAYHNGDYAKAEQLYRQAIKKDPHNPKLVFNLGNALAKQHKTSQALAAYDEARSMARANESRARSEYNMGNVFAGNKKWGKALDAYRRSLKADPDDPEAKYNYELAYRKMQRQRQQQKQQNKQNKNQKQNQSQNQQNQNQKNKKNNQKQQQQPSGGNQNRKNQQQQKMPQNGQMSKQQAKKILDALADQEKNVLKNLKKSKQKTEKANAKDW